VSRIAITDIRISEKCASALSSLGFEVLRMPPFSRLGEAVASHPDMLMCPIGDKIITHREYFDSNRNIFNRIADLTKKRIVTTDEHMCDAYPHDILFNALILNKTLFSLTEHTSKLLLNESAMTGYTSEVVKQGYSKCSVCPVSDSAAITSDTSLADAMIRHGIDVLKIQSGHILLPPYNYGFIGGASGYDSENVYFCGSVDNHPDARLIRDFCSKHKKGAVSLSDEPLLDVGSIFIF
jgi:hypothetical protein